MNKLNLDKKAYSGSPSTLCKGCGHDSITSNLTTALYELSVDPGEVIKLSGIGCSSKTPNYFLDSSFGFNSLHGRMAPLATGVNLSQPKAKLIGISGDGDTASIGLGGFLHLVRRNVPIVYIIANNGVYGLTKGQFSATSHKDDVSKIKFEQHLPELDMAFQALSAGCTFVARSFSGDNKQLKNILKLALDHNGTAVIDIVSPCVVYGNHDGFSKSYTHTQEINHPLHEIDLINDGVAISEEHLKFKLVPLEEQNHDTSSLSQALELILKEKEDDILHTGLIYLDKSKPNLNEAYGFSDKDKFSLKEEDLRLSQENFDAFNSGALV
ncbi:MAG: thiamine pyrophosphate-dependent enzyme [Bdellovibrionales bacterium]